MFFRSNFVAYISQNSKSAMLGQHGQFIDKTGRHGDQTKIAVSAWLAEDFSVGTYTMRQIEERVTSYAMLRNEDDGVDFSSGARSLAPMIRSIIGERLEKIGDKWTIMPSGTPRGSLGKAEAKEVIKRHLTVLDQRTVDSKDSRIEQLKAENALLLAQLEKERRGAAALEEAMVEPSLGMRSKDGVTAVGSLFGSPSSSSSSPLSDGVLEEGPEAGLRVFSSSMPTKLAVRDIYVSSGVAMYKMPYLMTATGWNTISSRKQMAITAPPQACVLLK